MTEKPSYLPPLVPDAQTLVGNDAVQQSLALAPGGVEPDAAELPMVLGDGGGGSRAATPAGDAPTADPLEGSFTVGGGLACADFGEPSAAHGHFGPGQDRKDSECAYMYSGVDDASLKFEAGFLDGGTPEGDRVQAATYQAQAGYWGEAGKRKAGLSGKFVGVGLDTANLASTTDTASGTDARLGGSMGEAHADGTIGPEGVSVGWGANIAEVHGSYASSNPGRADDAGVSGGLSVGAGWGVRLRSTDQDADGWTEYGAGGDVGPVSLDMYTELGGRSAPVPTSEEGTTPDVDVDESDRDVDHDR